MLSIAVLFSPSLAKGRLVTLSLDRANGKISLAVKKAPKVELEKVHKASHPAASSALVSGDRVFAYFGSYGLLCYDLDGRELWKKPMPTPKTFLRDVPTSLIAHRDLVIMALDNDANLPDSRLSQSSVVAAFVVRRRGRLGNPAAVPSQWLVDPDDLAAQPGHRVGRPRQRPCWRYDMKSGTQKWFASASPRPSPRRWQAGCRCHVSSSQAAARIFSPIPCRSGRR